MTENFKVYLSHSNKYDYENELYLPFQEVFSKSDCSIYLPELPINKGTSSKNIIKNSNLFIVECSRIGTGIGIECGWADAFNIPIVAIYQSGFKPSNSIKFLTDKIFEYKDINDLKNLILTIIKNYKNKK